MGNMCFNSNVADEPKPSKSGIFRYYPTTVMVGPSAEIVTKRQSYDMANYY